MRRNSILSAMVVIATLGLSAISGAAAPQILNFQGLLKDGVGAPVADGSHSVTFRLYNRPTGGSVLWTESISVTTSAGLFNALLGVTAPIPDSSLGDTACWLGVTVPPDPELSPRQKIVSVGYSFRVGTVDDALGGNIKSKVSIGPNHTNTGAHAFVAGANNSASGDTSVIAGGTFNRAAGMNSAIGGGSRDTASGDWSTIAGGHLNRATSQGSTVAGGFQNLASGGDNTFVGGGAQNTATGPFATIAGGAVNDASGSESAVLGGNINEATGDRATVGGGRGNRAVGLESTVAGGQFNRADSTNSTVVGGRFNHAAGFVAFVGGGAEDTAFGTAAVIAGGSRNSTGAEGAVVSGGALNRVAGLYSTVGGGFADTVAGDYATIPGGRSNSATGDFSLAAGRRAKANHDGAFVWADATDADFASTAMNQFLVRAAAMGLGTATPANKLDVEGSAAIGATFSGTSAAPVNGLLVEGSVGLGTTSPANKLDVEGSAVIGATYSGTNAAPANGLLVQGFVGIGTTAPGALLHVLRGGNVAANFERTASDGTIVNISQDGVAEGSISVSGVTVSYNAFTGSHYAHTEAKIERGSLVSLTGDNRNLMDRPAAEVIYGIRTSERANDPACLGAYLGLLESGLPAGADNPHLVMAVGNGFMWVVESERGIEPGDYLISSDVAGHAMKDDPAHFAVGHVVARAAERVDWSNVSDTLAGRKHKRVSVLFGNFVRSNTEALETTIRSLEERLQKLEAETMRAELP